MAPDSAQGRVSKFEAALERARRDASYAAYSALANAQSEAPAGQLAPFKLAVLRNFTVEPLLPVIEAQLILAGRLPDTYVADFNTTATEALNPDAGLYHHQADAIIIANWLEAAAPRLANAFPEMTAAEVAAEIDRLCDETVRVLGAIRRRSQAPVLINNFPLPDPPAMGILDAQGSGHSAAVIRLNQALQSAVAEIADVYWVDYLSLFAGHGYRRAADDRHWAMAKAPLGRDILASLGRHYGALIRALIGRVSKCLVLDCDNTLWGGIVGEDGIDGIKVGPDHGGAAYYALQREALNLRSRGVMLAINSKNNEADVLEVLNDHPGMLLKENHFVSLQINWDDKATNLRRIAEELNIGLDALVFVDDSTFECDYVRQALPEVEVLHLTGEPSGYRRLLADRAYFDTLTLSAEDAKRSDMMAAERTRKRMAASAETVEDYLRGLDIRAEIGTPGPREIGRVAQLTQKTNQFNLTTRRYTEGDIERFIADSDWSVYHLKLSDKVADIGLIGVALAKASKADDRLEIDTFLMSCRALGRGAEQALLARVVADAADRGLSHVTGSYLPTRKNGQVEGFYEKQGFRKAGEDGDGVVWQTSSGAASLRAPDWITLTDGAPDTPEDTTHKTEGTTHVGQ